MDQSSGDRSSVAYRATENLSRSSSSFLSSVPSSSSSSSLDYAAFKAHVLGLSDEYLLLARWYVGVGGSDFLSFLSSNCPHLASDASRDFPSGSSVLLSTLRSMPSALPPQALASAPLPPPGFAAALLQPSPYPPATSVSSSFSLPGSRQSAAPLPSSALPFSSASSVALSHLSLFSSGLSSASTVPPSSSLSSGVLSGFAAVADPVAHLAVPVSSPSLFRPFDVPSAPVGLAGTASAPYGSVSALVSSAPSFGSTSFLLAPPQSEAPPPSSFCMFMPGSSSDAPPRSSFTFADDDCDPDLGDPAAPGPEAPLPPSVPDSVRAEICRMYAYVVSLFPQAAGALSAPPPPRALFEDFFSASSAPHQPVYLSWFERVRTALAEADSRMASLLAAGRADSSIIPQRLSQCAVHGELAVGNAVPVNPSLLSMFERSLRPSLQLGLSLREAALLESSSRFHSESLSHSLWLLSALLAFVRLQGFSPADASLFNTLVTSLSKCLAH